MKQTYGFIPNIVKMHVFGKLHYLRQLMNYKETRLCESEKRF